MILNKKPMIFSTLINSSLMNNTKSVKKKSHGVKIPSDKLRLKRKQQFRNQNKIMLMI